MPNPVVSEMHCGTAKHLIPASVTQPEVGKVTPVCLLAIAAALESHLGRFR